MYQLSKGRERGLLALLALTQFTVIMDFMVMLPLGPQIMHAFAITPTAFATAVSAYALCSGLSSLFAATYIDRFDRRRLMLAVYAVFTLSNFACALAPSFALLVMARAFAGLTGGVLGAIVMAILSDVIPSERRGMATGTVMMSFSLAAVAGVPVGIVLGAQFGWAATFYLLVGLSLLIWAAGAALLPSLSAHLDTEPAPLRRVVPELVALIRQPQHLRAYALSFALMLSHMLVIPFIAPVLVANYRVEPEQLSWIYLAGGGASFFSARLVGRLADRYGKHLVFRVMVLLSMAPVLFLTHMPALPFVAIVAFFAVFMIVMSGRFVPLQALTTTIPAAAQRGAFLSVNSAIQSLGTGCGAWLGGSLLSKGADGRITGYGMNGWIAVALLAVTLVWVGRVRAAKEQAPLKAA